MPDLGDFVAYTPRQQSPAEAGREVPFVDGAAPFDLLSQWADQHRGNHRDPLPATFRPPDPQLSTIEIQVLQPQLESLFQSETRAVKHTRHEMLRSLHLPQDLSGLSPSQHGR